MTTRTTRKINDDDNNDNNLGRKCGLVDYTLSHAIEPRNVTQLQFGMIRTKKKGYEFRLTKSCHDTRETLCARTHKNDTPRSSMNCEGCGDVVGVLALLVDGVAQAFHGDRVVELRVQLGVEEVDGERQEGNRWK